MQNSEDAQLYPLLNQKAVVAVFHKDENPLVDGHSALFDNGRRRKTSLDSWLRDREVDELIAMNPATDYCVKFTVLDVPQLGYKVNATTDGCRSMNIQPQDSTHVFMKVSTVGATLYTLVDWEGTQG